MKQAVSLIQNLSENIKLLLREHTADRRKNPVKFHLHVV